MSKEPVAVPSKLVVPHRIVKVGVAGERAKGLRAVPPDTVADPVGRRAIAQANEAVRDLPKPERISKVKAAGEAVNGVTIEDSKVPSMVPTEIGEVYPGEHRYAYQLEPGDLILNLGKPTPEIGRWVKVGQVQLIQIDDTYTEAEIHGVGEAGYPLVLNMAANSQVRIVTNQENPYG
jgi:hypothetical protein